ncbi:MAG: OmcA/MtrC family decaheme c-type cytochrome [Deinococcus sp.]|nr:OmcA/MtrC family decaheme c-type cytochrome [Deinococcus sp.]
MTFTARDAAGNLLALRDFAGPLFGIAAFSWISVDEASGLTGYQAYTVAETQGAPYVYQGETQQPVLASVVRPAFVERLTPENVTEVSPGILSYTPTTVLPEGYVASATHTVGLALRQAPDKDSVNATYSFIPAGGPVTVTRQLVDIANCNSCHDQLTFHGGFMRDTTMCVLCHTSQHVDPETGRTLEFKNMVHDIHRGRNLPSVQAGQPYYIVGSRQRVFDFGEIGWPRDIRNCTTCHANAPQADNYRLAPSRAACGSCHDNIDFATGQDVYGGRDHLGGAQLNDNLCASCHVPDSGQEFDASVVGAHTIPERSKQLQGVNFALEGATVKPGEQAQVDFSIQDNAGTFLDPNTFNYLELTLAHPTTDYAHRITEVVNRIVPAGQPPFTRTGTLTDLGGGQWRYTFTNPIDADWSGTAAIGIGGYKATIIKGNEGQDVTVREGNLNPVIYVSLDGTQPVPRRAVVDRANCNQCHLDLGNPAGISIHGGIRRSTEYCVLCHNPNHTDEARRPQEEMPPESVHFKYMIHSLHMGAERLVPTEFIGFATAKTEEVRFPADQRNCENCHIPGTNLLPLPEGVLPTMITQAGQVVKVMQPITAACTACHTGRPGADAHEETMTSSTGAEACAVCHGRGREFAVEKVHMP